VYHAKRKQYGTAYPLNETFVRVDWDGAASFEPMSRIKITSLTVVPSPAAEADDVVVVEPARNADGSLMTWEDFKAQTEAEESEAATVPATPVVTPRPNMVIIEAPAPTVHTPITVAEVVGLSNLGIKIVNAAVSASGAVYVAGQDDRTAVTWEAYRNADDPTRIVFQHGHYFDRPSSTKTARLGRALQDMRERAGLAPEPAGCTMTKAEAISHMLAGVVAWCRDNHAYVPASMTRDEQAASVIRAALSRLSLKMTEVEAIAGYTIRLAGGYTTGRNAFTYLVTDPA
jgi:hypothetical protein